ncbi:MAG: flagellin [Deltaproteobacteria bacterium]|nr:flagellin [Deltaproteobacteria bacterium]
MSLRVNHNISALNSHRNMQINDAGMSKTLERLSSGMKINRASDGPAALVISEQMRGQIAGLTQAIDNSETAISMIQTTEANLNEVSTLLTSIRQLSIHAANEAVNDEYMLAADQQEIRNALDTMNRISKQAQFGRRKLLNGTNGASGSTTGKGLQFLGASIATMDSSKNGFDVNITHAATRANASGTTALTLDMVKAGETLTVIEDGKMATYTTTEDDNVDTTIKNLQSQIEVNGLNIDISENEGVLQLVHRKYGSDYGFQVSSSTAGVLSQEGGAIEMGERGSDVRGKINGETAMGKGQTLTGIDGAQSVDGLSVRFTGEVGMEGDVPLEGEYVGKVYVTQNSVRFQVGGNYNQMAGLSIESTHADTLGRNIDNISGYKNLDQIDVRTFQGAQDALKLIDDAVTKLASRRGELGAFQKNTLESNLSNLRSANENLISSESVLRDLDMAHEMATFTRNQVMTQSATAMLAQANQMPQTVLKLLA